MELKFTSEKISKRVTRIFAFIAEMAYLVEGEHEAVLLDSASGYGDLREYVSSLTDKPVRVLISHGHVDHALGCGDFDRVYMSPLEKGVYAHQSSHAFRVELAEMVWPDFHKLSPGQMRSPLPFEKFLPLSDGDVFELGGVSVEVLACPGHTYGSMVFLVPEERLLFLGDGCSDMVFLFDEFSTCVEDYRDALLSLDERTAGRYDATLMSHGSGWGEPDMVQRLIAICQEIMDGRDEALPFSFQNQPSRVARAINPDRTRRDGGSGNVAYHPEKIFRVK